MKILFWNIRGFGRPARRRQIREYIMEESLDIVGLQETIKQDFSQKDLQEIVNNVCFRWSWLPATGHSGGILVGVKEDILEVEQEDKGVFYVSLVIRNRLTNVRWELITVYGPANHSLSADFISELSRKCLTTDLPLIIGGDFNMIREVEDKSNGTADRKLMEKFNFFIDLHQLREIKKSGSKYT